MSEQRRLPYGRQHIDESDVQAVVDALRSDWLTTGPRVAKFESELAQRGGVEHAVAVNSGTAALHCAYFAAGLERGDEVITSPLTFVATASAAMHLGARVRFCDVDRHTGNLDPTRVEECLNTRTKLLVPVDYAGQPGDYDSLRSLAARHSLTLIADAAHSFGATYRGEPVGGLADMTTTSFHPVKLLTTAEGGALLTQRADWARRAQEFRNHGIQRSAQPSATDEPAWHYEIHSLGFNYRIPDLCCALGSSQMRRLDAFLARRRAIASRYDECLGDLTGLELPTVHEEVSPAWHLYVLRVREAGRRREFFEGLRAEGMGVQLHYIPVHLQPVFAGLGYERGMCPVAEDFADRALSIPIFPGMSESDLDWSIETVRRVAGATL